MKGLPAILIGLLAYFFVGASTGSGQEMYGLKPNATGTPPPGVVETYKVVNGMSIRAVVFNPQGSGTHRVAIVIHGGGYSSGDMQTDIAQELSQYGFMGVAIEYRLAPPHTEMNTPAHPFPGQNDIDDDGHYPEQTDDVRDAIVHYRDDPRSNGEVVLVSCSAGASHTLYLAATGTPGYDMPDLAVLLSCAGSNLTDPNEWALECVGGEVCPHNAVANYLNFADPAPNPPVGNDLVLAQEASSTRWMHVGMCPFWVMCSSRDSVGIPTSSGFNIRSYLPNNMPGVLENGENGIVPTALAVGLTESTSSEPEANSFKATIVPVSVWSHSFDYWDQVKGDVISWISGPIPAPPTPTPTPAPTGAPVVVTNPATNVNNFSVTLNGTVNPTGLSTTVYFEYGTTTTYGSNTSTQTYSGSTTQNVTANVTNLSAGATYHFRIVGSNTAGTSYGPDSTFTTPTARAIVADFNGDSWADLVIQDPITHDTAAWYLSNNVVIGAAFGPTLPTGWSLGGAADFNGDSHTDYAVFNSVTGQTALLFLSNLTVVGAAIGPSLSPGWELIGAADFNGDGVADYVLYKPGTGETAIWHLNNFPSPTTGPTLPSGWNLVGVADFNNDGHPDYALFNSVTGEMVIVYLSDATIIGAAFGPSIPVNWPLVATADFNQDGYPDYLLYNPPTGQTAIIYLNNNVVVGAAFGPTVPGAWSLTGQ